MLASRKDMAVRIHAHSMTWDTVMRNKNGLLLISSITTALLVGAAPASACGNFPFSQGPGFGTSSTSNRALNIGDVVTVTYTNPGTSTLRIYKSAPSPVVDLVPTTGPGAGSGTYTATATGSYTFDATRPTNDGQFANVNYTCAAAPAPVPTLDQWAMIILAALLAGGAALYLERRRWAA